MRHRGRGQFIIWLGIWSAIEGTEYLFGSLADLGLLPNWLSASLPYVFNILSFSVVVIALLAFLDLSRDKLRLFLQGAIVVGLAIAGGRHCIFLTYRLFVQNHAIQSPLRSNYAYCSCNRCRCAKTQSESPCPAQPHCAFSRHPAVRFGGALWQLAASIWASESARNLRPAGVCSPVILLWICCRAEHANRLVTVRKGDHLVANWLEITVPGKQDVSLWTSSRTSHYFFLSSLRLRLPTCCRAPPTWCASASGFAFPGHTVFGWQLRLLRYSAIGWPFGIIAT